MKNRNGTAICDGENCLNNFTPYKTSGGRFLCITCN